MNLEAAREFGGKGEFDREGWRMRSDKELHSETRQPSPDVDHIPVPPDTDKGAPVRIPPDQPSLPEEDQPDPPPKGDKPSNEPTRLV